MKIKYRKPFLIVASIVFALGVVMTWIAENEIRRGRAAEQWPVVQGKIIDRYIMEDNAPGQRWSGSMKVYELGVRYEYEFSGTRFTSDRISFYLTPHFYRRAQAEQCFPGWTVGQSVDVYVDPLHPSQSVLKPGISSFQMTRFRTGILITVISAIFICWLWLNSLAILE